MQALPLQQVLAIARQRRPSVSGLVFDGLVGPWVEVVAEGLYRVSPLLREVGKDVRARTGRRGYIVASPAPFGLHTLSADDVSAILFHGIAGPGP